MTDRVVSPAFWARFSDEDLAERAVATRAKAQGCPAEGPRHLALVLADEMTAELARRAMEDET